MKRVIDLHEGVAFVVTDLHGAWEPYARYRDHFLSLYYRGEAEYLIFLGDVIHGYGEPEEDQSVRMILDIMDLQDELGAGRVIMCLGNHEMPHIYGITLSKGHHQFTPRFEHALGDKRDTIVSFLKRLPFIVRTSGGTLLTHAGAEALVVAPDIVEFLLNLSHESFLDEARILLERDDILDLLVDTLRMPLEEYDRIVEQFFAVNDPTDPRYLILFQGVLIGNFKEFSPLWDFLFSQCEGAVRSLDIYHAIVQQYLAAYSRPEMLQRVLVSGHISVRGGCEVITDQHLRLASYAHASPNQSGRYLLFDVAKSIASAHDLSEQTHRLFG